MTNRKTLAQVRSFAARVHDFNSQKTASTKWLRPNRTYACGRGSSNVAVDFTWSGPNSIPRKAMSWELSEIDQTVAANVSPSLALPAY